MARNKKLYRASARQTSTVTLLIAFLAINLAGFVGYENISCQSGRLSPDLMRSLETMLSAATILAVYAMISLIKRRITLRPFPLEGPAALIGLLLSIAWTAVYFLSCERLI